MLTALVKTRSRRAALGVAALVVAMASLFVLSDATEYPHYKGDATIGQVPGDYVRLDLWIGATSPTAWARRVEQLLASVLAILSMITASAAASGSVRIDRNAQWLYRLVYVGGVAFIALVVSQTMVGPPSWLVIGIPLLLYGAFVFIPRRHE